VPNQALGLRHGSEAPPNPSNQVHEYATLLGKNDPISFPAAYPCHPLCWQPARDRLRLPETQEWLGHGWGPGQGGCQ
jgi:hypothetical protein